MKSYLYIACLAASFAAIGCDRNRVGDEEGYIEPAAAERSTIKTGTSEKDAQTAGYGSATGPAEETSGGTYGTGQVDPVPGADVRIRPNEETNSVK